jgi:predicted O-methyltransferase YrrM
MYSTRTAVGASGKPFSMTSGLSTINNLSVLRRILLERKPQRTLEVGMACGGSALTFAATHKDNSAEAIGQHVAIDGFQKSGFDDVGRLQLQRAGLDQYVSVRERLSSYELADLAETGARFGVIYIDGSHQFEDVFCDFYFARLILEQHGLILFDDSSDPEVNKVIKFIQKNLQHSFKQVPTASYRDLSIVDKLKYQLAEKLHKTQLTIFEKTNDETARWNLPLVQF